MNIRSIACQLLLAVSVLLLPSCGGGGGGGNEPPVIPDSSDTAAPQVALLAPVNLAADLTGAVTLGATASDNIAVTRVEFEVDGLPSGADDTPPFAASVNTADHAAGQHVVRARALDAAGNASAWAEATVKFGGSNAVPAGFTKNDRFITSLSQATALAQAPDGRLFIAEQGGAVRVFKVDGLLP